MSSHPAGKVVIIIGAASDVGRATGLTLLSLGHTVVGISRKLDSLNTLKEQAAKYGDKLVLLEGDISADGGAKKIYDAVIQKFGRVDQVIASIGVWRTLLASPGLLQLDYASIAKAHQEVVAPHLKAAQFFVPALAEQKIHAGYTIIGGAAGEQFIAPNWDLLGVTGAALYGVSTLLRGSTKDLDVRVNEFRFGFAVVPDGKQDQPWQVSESEISKSIASVVLDDALKGELVALRSKDDLKAAVTKFDQFKHV